MTVDLGNQTYVEKRGKALRTKRARVREALLWVVSDVRGRQYLADLVRETRCMQTTQLAMAQDAILFREGQRAVGFKILNDLRELGDLRPLGDVLGNVLNPNPDGVTDGGSAAEPDPAE